ncbi:hypothetical protein [Mycolicibacterium sphagni]|uniref:hypothetical protein n=1 Tax=Mycolicibacterium sphagni TaxID=1786 RepID=UPI001F04A235|nr:hypothetical protein [Mycolicibacterium sphagni]
MTDGVGVEAGSSAAGTDVSAVTAEAADVRVRVGSSTTGAEWELLALTLLVGLALAGAPVDGRADRADDDALLDGEELVVDACPESSGAALATAVPAPAAISKPAPTANPRVVIRPARLMDVIVAPARITVNKNN